MSETPSQGFDGFVFRPGDDGYEEARRGAVWNEIKPNRFPSVIVMARSEQDVVRAVNLARAEGISIGVRSGGHNWVANAIREGGLLLDMSLLKAINIDAEARVASVESGVLGRDFSTALSVQGLFFPVGHCSTPGIVGYILGGGFGFNMVEVGPAAFSLLAMDVVTADGERLHVTDEEHADLLWAARGCGPGFFAVITRLYLKLRPTPGAMAAALQIHPMAAYEDLMEWYDDQLTAWCNDDRERVGLPMMVGGVPPISDQKDIVLTFNTYAFGDDFDDAAAKLARMETMPGLDRAILHLPAHPSSVEATYAVLDMQYPHGLRYLSDNVWLDDPIDRGFWPDAKAVIEGLPTPQSVVWLLPGVSGHSHPNAAHGVPSHLNYQVYGAYDDPADDEAMLAWHNDAMDRIDKYSIGATMVNDSNLFERPRAILVPEKAERLEALRRKYDPEGRFYGYAAELPPARVPAS